MPCNPIKGATRDSRQRDQQENGLGSLQVNHPLCARVLIQDAAHSRMIIDGGETMKKVAFAATLLSLALVGSASAQGVATNPVTGAATGAAAGAAQGAAAAGPVGALVGAPLGLATGAVAGTLGAVGTVAGGLAGAPYALAGGLYNYCPAGYTPVTPPNTLPANITGVGYCQALVASVAFAQPTTRVAYGAPRRAVARVAYRRSAAYRRVGFRTRATIGSRQVGLRTRQMVRARQVGFRTGQAHGRMAAMNRARVY